QVCLAAQQRRGTPHLRTGMHAPAGHQTFERVGDALEHSAEPIEAAHARRNEKAGFNERGPVCVIGIDSLLRDDFRGAHSYVSLRARSIVALWARILSLLTINAAPYASRRWRPSANFESLR